VMGAQCLVVSMVAARLAHEPHWRATRVAACQCLQQ
jgi:hypothetical protein